ncbi:MAG: aminotransferase [Pseudomonadota bacterium]
MTAVPARTIGSSAPLNPALAGALASPIMTAAGWVAEAPPIPGRPLINLAQAAPSDPPPHALREAMARAALDDPGAHLYGPVLGDDVLREAIAARWSAIYGGPVASAEVAVTSGCNQAFCAAVASLAAAGDEVILPNPWYFNHKMWLDMAGARAVPLPCGEDCLPDPKRAAALIGPRTRAIVLVTPNNPTGVEYPPALVDEFFELCASRGLALIVDETYRDYLAAEDAPHRLFARGDWEETLIQLYSFSKAYHLTGHRIGALVAGRRRVAEIEKFLDTVTICPARLGQVAALEGLRSQAEFVAAERSEFAARRAALETAFAEGVGGWRLLGAGAYFAFVRHPYDEPAEAAAKRLVREAGVLILPGTFFAPPGDEAAERTMRVAFANVAAPALTEALDRLAAA